jgi:hypothetical protein
MKRYKTKVIFFIFVLLFACLYSRSDNINHADADYCIDWGNDKTEFDARVVKLVFVKKHNDFKIRLNIQDSIKCTHVYRFTSSSQFSSVDELGRKLFTFELLRKINENLVATLYYCSGCDPKYGQEPEFVKILRPEIPFVFPDTSGTLLANISEYKKDDLLQLKGKTINAYVIQYISCYPDLDTTFNMDFRVRIMGECESTKR